MKRFIQMSLLLTIVLLTASVSWGQDHFQPGDVFAGIGNGQIRWYRGGEVIHTLSVGTSTFDTGMAFDSAQNLYATDFSLGDVSKFDVHGNSSLFAGDFGAVSPESLVFDSAGNLLVGDANSTLTDSGRKATIWKLDPTGNLLNSFTVAIENRGADWIDLAADQKTIFYTSEGHLIKRFDISANHQLSDFASALPGTSAFALKILPNGNVLVADTSAVLQLNTSGAIIHTYRPCDGDCGGLFSLNLDPDGLHFWVGDSTTGNIYEIRIADAGTVVDQIIFTGVLPAANSNSGLFGVIVFGEITSANTVNLVFPPNPNPQTLIATIAPNGNNLDLAAQSLALTLHDVPDPAINVAVSFFYEPTDVSTLTTGVGIADGICENGATEATDFDCRLTPDFTYQTLVNGDKIVPHIIPSHDNLGVWVRVIATKLDGSPAVAGVDYNVNGGNVKWYYAWNANLPLANSVYPQGWNILNPQMYDRPGAIADPAFIFNISDYTKICLTTCVNTADPGKGGHTTTLNDIVVAAPPNPLSGVLDEIQPLVPQNGRAPFPYLKGLPMLVAFTLENESAEKSDPTALTPPHSVSVATLDSAGNPITVQFPKRFPTTFTYNPFLKVYYIFLSPAPYTPGTVYTLQISSDQSSPISVNFVVKNSLF